MTRLGAVLHRDVRLNPDRQEVLRRGLEDGVKFYASYNEARLNLAFDSFDEDMRKAFFEILYLLHVNESSLANITYKARRSDTQAGVPRLVEVTERANLHVQGAPHGVRGVGSLSPVFRAAFQQFIQKEFGTRVPEGSAASPAIVCLQSIGSIGTIGHKSGDSDLDLQVVYDLLPGSHDLSQWDDERIRDALQTESRMLLSQLCALKKIPKTDFRKPEVMAPVQVQAQQLVAKSYPELYRYMAGSAPLDMTAEAGPQFKSLRTQLLNELLRLIKRNASVTTAAQVRQGELLLKQRVQSIQKYVNDKYPGAEIYMFLCSLSRYRAGKYASSLDFKESSGSGYELILNYETLMPGIQFTPTIPSQFLFPPFVNNNKALFQQLHDYMEIGALELYREIFPSIVNLGHVPDLNGRYVAEHGGAVYWEAFKASSGNLPKAVLNLFRYEMLLEPKFLKTIVQIIKEPDLLNHLVTLRGDTEALPDETTANNESGLPTWHVLELEQEHPPLLQDPWWLRYKALKIGFCEPQGVPGLDAGERFQVSRVIDLAFALHVRISDVFRKPGDTRPVKSHREQVLVDFLQHAFPPKSEKRTFLQHIFAGEIQAVSAFEADLRELFRRALRRCQDKIAAYGCADLHRDNEEVKLWAHYYQEHFEPKQNVVQKTIMNHLTFARGRVRIGYVPGQGWLFKSLQRQSGVGKRFDTFGILEHLPDEIVLVDKTSFLAGLATCIVNGYYGIINRGQLKESRTALEFDGTHMDMGNKLDNQYAYLRPDHVDRIMSRVLEFFPAEYHHYTDSIRVDRRVRKVFLLLNLWRFGRLSILYRDNLNTWFVDEFDHPDLVEQAEALRKKPEAFFACESLHLSLNRFLVSQRLFFDELEVATWVNPNSLETTHSRSQPEVEERDLALAFESALRTYQKHRG